MNAIIRNELDLMETIKILREFKELLEEVSIGIAYLGIRDEDMIEIIYLLTDRHHRIESISIKFLAYYGYIQKFLEYF